jgi:hypothetical protein
MCEAVTLSHRSTKDLFVPVMNEKTNYPSENQQFNGRGAEILSFIEAKKKRNNSELSRH